MPQLCCAPFQSLPKKWHHKFSNKVEGESWKCMRRIQVEGHQTKTKARTSSKHLSNHEKQSDCNKTNKKNKISMRKTNKKRKWQTRRDRARGTERHRERERERERETEGETEWYQWNWSMFLGGEKSVEDMLAFMTEWLRTNTNLRNCRCEGSINGKSSTRQRATLAIKSNLSEGKCNAVHAILKLAH